MQFHECHGKNLRLSEGGQVARRLRGSSHGIAFSLAPIPLGQSVRLVISELNRGWTGGLRYGFTNLDPALMGGADRLPEFAVPDLSSRPGFWVLTLDPSRVALGNQLTYFVDSEGVLWTRVNGEPCGSSQATVNLADARNQRLWALVELSGVTSALRLISTADLKHVPSEIMARGPKAVKCFQDAYQKGAWPMYHSRLMVVGEDGVGKTSLVKALTGQSFNRNEKSTVGIDADTSYRITSGGNTTGNRCSWKSCSGQGSGDDDPRGDSDVGGISEDDLHTIASNIVQEVIYKRQGQGGSQASGLPDLEEDGEAEAGGRSFVEAQLARFQDVPERALQLAREMLGNLDPQTPQAPPDQPLSAHQRKHIDLNVWDFSGKQEYYTTHQAFLSPRAVYLLVLDLCNSLEPPHQPSSSSINDQQSQLEPPAPNHLEYLEFWLSSIHTHAALSGKDSPEKTTVSPPVFIVGTHKDGLHSNQEEREKLIEEKFTRIRDIIKGKSYQTHVVSNFYAIECADDCDKELVKLREHIERVLMQEPYMGEEIPVTWLNFQQVLQQQTQRGTYYLSMVQLMNMAKEEGGISNRQELLTLLEFYHDLGAVVYYGGSGAVDLSFHNTVILKPQWLIDVFSKVMSAEGIDKQWSRYMESWFKLESKGLLDDRLVDHLWRDVLDQKLVLIGLMEKFDLLCERLPPKELTNQQRLEWEKSYYVPLRLKEWPTTEAIQSLANPSNQDVQFYVSFGDFLPEGLFHRMLVRAIRWSQEQSGHNPQLYHGASRFYIDDEHDFLLQLEPSHSPTRIKVLIMRLDTVCEAADDEEECETEPPDPKVCAKVRNFLDSALNDLRELWMKRLKYEFVVVCPCGKPTLHYLNLDHCLNNKVVLCDHQRIKTGPFRKWFPQPKPILAQLPPIIVPPGEKLDEDKLPSWVKGCAKLLNAGSDGSDWSTLAEKLGYKKAKVEKFGDEVNPGLELVTDWIHSSGNTNLSIEMMVSCLEQMHREDVIDIIQKGQESSGVGPSIFISYNWDIQAEVKQMRSRLEQAGFTCWMDIGQMGGGDALYEKIYQGMRNAKVVIACLTPKYIVSHSCSREIHLADLLGKPIIPVMFENSPWPPPGPMSIIFSQLIYVQMKGVGGHGGLGVVGDSEAKYQEIINQAQCYVDPLPPKTVLPVPDPHSYQPYQGGGGRQKIESTLSTKTTSTLTSLLPQTYQQRGGGSVHSHPGGVNSQRGRGGVPQVAVTRCTVCSIL